MKLTIPPAAANLRGVPFTDADAEVGGRLAEAAEEFVREIVLTLRANEMTPIAPPNAKAFRLAFITVAASLADTEFDMSDRNDRSYQAFELKHMQFFFDLCASDAKAVWPDLPSPPPTHAGVAHAAAHQIIPDELVQKPSAETATTNKRKKSKVSSSASSGGRSQSYTVKEDVACGRAYYGASCDAITGNDQKGSSFWAKVSGRFDAIMEKEKMAESSGHEICFEARVC